MGWSNLKNALILLWYKQVIVLSKAMNWGIYRWYLVGLWCTVQVCAIAAPCDKQLNHFEVLVDSGYSLAEAMRSPNYQSRDALQFGYTQETYWVRFTVPELCEKENYLNLEFWGLDYLDIYLIKNGHVSDSLKTGYMRPLDTREMPLPQFIKTLPPSFEAGDTVYVKMWKYEGTMMTNVYVQDEEVLDNYANWNELTMLFFLGVCFIMLMLSLSYYIYFRLNMFIWYAALLVTFAFNKAVNFGYGSLYIWGDFDWLTIYGRSIWMAPSLLFFLLFAHQLLRVRQYSPKWVHKIHQVLVWMMIVETPLAILPLPPYPWRMAMYMTLMSSITLTAIIYLVAAIKAVKNKHLPGYLFLACELILLVATILLMMRNFSIIPVGWVPPNLHIHMFLVLMPLTLFSLITYTKTMHVVKVPYKPGPKPLNEEAAKKAEEAYQAIEKAFATDKPYLDDSLTVDMLSESINLPSHLISRAINTYAEKHFFDYVNSYRIEEAKRLLLDEEAQKTYTIEGIAGLCGFKNKTSFNKAFKKFTGQTPSAYRQQRA